MANEVKKAALITGASSGLGAHFAEVLAANGYHLQLVARRTDKLEALAERLRGDGASVETVLMDVTDSTSIANAISGLSRAPDILINNAGVADQGPALETTESAFDVVLDTNLKGTMLVSQAVARLMRDDGRSGVIVNIASILGLRVAGGVSAYTASKAALIQLTKAHALEWARYGIRVNALCPGYIQTPLNQAFFETDAGKALIKRIPQRRLGKLGDLDAPLLLLISDEAAYITGCALPVDGGHLVSSL